MSMLPPTVQPWASTWPGITPTGTQSGLASLPGSVGGILSRGLPPTPTAVTPLASPLGFSGGLASQVPSGVGAEAFSAANALRGAGSSAGESVLSNLASQATGFRGAAASGRASLPGILAEGGLKGGAARFAPTLATGFAADKLFGKGDESVAQQAGRGFVRGAGWGAVAAPAVAAIPGVNLVGVPLIAVAAGITGTIGAALDVLDAGHWFGGGGSDKPAVDPDAVLTNILHTAQLDPDTSQQILDGYAITMQLAATIEDKQQRAAAEATALQQAGQMALDALQQRDQATSAASNTLALQAQAGQIFEPLAKDIEQSGLLYADAMRGIRGNLPESYRAIADATTARELSSSQKLANAYRAQAQITPAVNQLAQYQQDYNSFAAQQFAQAMAQQAAGQSASLGPSASDLQALLQPTG